MTLESGRKVGGGGGFDGLKGRREMSRPWTQDIKTLAGKLTYPMLG